MFMDSFFDELPPRVILIRIAAAVLLGGIIGIDREFRRSQAGLRTHMLTALASAVFGMLAVATVRELERHGSDSYVDPLRAVEAVTTGVAFLAAGTIIRTRGEVRGLTTGASIWLAGAIGVSSGLGYFFLAAVATVAALFILVAIGWLQVALAEKVATPKQPVDD